ncbi:MAG: class I SAM-dependent methyltransferase [Pseudomonadota bacterium]
MSVLDQSAEAQMQKALAAEAPLDRRLNGALRILSKWRSQKLANTVARQEGRIIRSGAFAGMAYGVATEGALAPRLLGAYEASLTPVIEEIIRSHYPRVIDVGCAEGYYAVGLALRMPWAQVLAHDASEIARKHCTDLAKQNGVADRVTVGGLLGHDGFDDCATIRTVVVCDIEGAEGELLDPAQAPGLEHADILVECHDMVEPGITQKIYERFRATHHVRSYGRALRPEVLPDWAENLSDLDRLLLLWEWRSGPTDWLWMTARHGPPTEEAAT